MQAGCRSAAICEFSRQRRAAYPSLSFRLTALCNRGASGAALGLLPGATFLAIRRNFRRFVSQLVWYRPDRVDRNGFRDRRDTGAVRCPQATGHLAKTPGRVAGGCLDYSPRAVVATGLS